jgi:predicted TPR repeat methyltransferase
MSSKDTLSATNDFAPNYDDYIKQCHWVGPDILFGLMFSNLKPNQTILDIGIGTGLCSALFKQFGLKVYGIDGSETMIELCTGKAIAEELKLVDLTEEQSWFENKIFNHFVSQGVLHLIGDLKPIFNQTAKALSKNGCFGFTYESIQQATDGYTESSIRGIFERENASSGIKVYRHTYEYIMELLRISDFQMIKKSEFLAFVDPITNVKTYFDAIVAQKK